MVTSMAMLFKPRLLYKQETADEVQLSRVGSEMCVRASSMGARWLASRENRADLIGGIAPMQAHAEAAPVLIDLSRTAQISQSRRLGSTVLGELQQLGPLHKVKVEQAGFAVLRTPDMPSILVETAFISNPQEEQKLRDPLEQERIARALTRGILAYVRRLPPRSTV